ncbi:cupin [Bacillus sp. FJAT-27225]|uniref:cupin n=1 Tax=Bacillus sp. FJAT-27225 TaxID=1743144 RepID=UPI00080C30FA|nr:cupin [Bacillus sp. FJAT-27225]OCA85794.1 cupin [Bacillus sp. FJAT-27225]
MRLFKFDKSVGNKISVYDSNFILSRIVRTNTPVSIGCMHLGQDGIIGRHEATCPQLLLIVDGEGEVSGEDRVRKPIQKGQAVYWEAGENHETTSQNGLTAIVIESDELSPSKLMKMKE